MESAKANAVPMVVLWIAAVVTAVAYYAVPGVAGLLEPLAKWQRDNAIPVAQARKVRPEELVGKIVYGELWCCERPEYTQQYAAIIERARGKEK